MRLVFSISREPTYHAVIGSRPHLELVHATNAILSVTENAHHFYLNSANY